MIQVKYEGQQEARGVAKNHAMFKHARAAIGAFMLTEVVCLLLQLLFVLISSKVIT